MTTIKTRASGANGLTQAVCILGGRHCGMTSSINSGWTRKIATLGRFDSGYVACRRELAQALPSHDELLRQLHGS